MSTKASLLLSALEQEFTKARDPVRASKQASYLRNQFVFFGLPKQTRALLQVAIFKKYIPANEQELTEMVLLLWNLEHREFHHAALDLAVKYQKLFSAVSIGLFDRLIRTRSWWDSVDAIATRLVGSLAYKFPEVMNVIDSWVMDDCLWVRRSAIIFQMHWRMATNEDVLFDNCRRLMSEKDFFIRKAIGWALRQYSKSKPCAVRNFISLYETQLSSLSLREARKYL